MDWRTPRPVLDLVRAVRPILIDPASTSQNPTGALLFGARDAPIGARLCGGTCIGDGLRAGWASLARALAQPVGYAQEPGYLPGISGIGFVQPPYGAHLSGPVEPEHEIWRTDRKTGVRTLIGIGRGWAAKYAQESRAGLESIALVPVRTDAEWWHTMADASTLGLFWRSPTLGARISFVNPDTGRPVQGSNLASTVFYSGPEPERFRGVFSPHGRIFVP